MSELSHQDWKPVTLHRTYTTDEKLKNAQRSGQTTSINKNTVQYSYSTYRRGIDRSSVLYPSLLRLALTSSGRPAPSILVA